MRFRSVFQRRRTWVLLLAALATATAAALAFGVSERPAAAQSEPQTVGEVTGLTASAQGQPGGAVQLTWNAAENAQVYFVVYSKTSDLMAGSYGSVQMRPFNGTEGTIDGLDGGVPYSFTVTGMRWNWINYGAVWGNFATWQHETPSGVATSPASGGAQTEPQTVGEVTGLTATTQGQPDGAVQLTWNAAENAQVYFVVYSKTSDLMAGSYGSVQMRPFSGNQGTIDGLDGGVPYSFTVTGMRWNWINYGAVWGNFAAWQHETPSGTAAATIPFSALERGAWLEQNQPALANQLKALPWVSDGVDDSERGTAEALTAAARWYPVVFNALMQMPWLGDGVTDAEAIAVRYIRFTAFFDSRLPGADLTGQMLRKSWVQDAITADEAEVIRHLYFIVRYDTDSPPSPQVIAAVNAAASRILAMPFLASVESPDALAVRSLERIEDVGKADFLQVMARPTLNDGITDAEAEIVLLLGATYQYAGRALVDTLLDPARIIVEKRRVILPLSGAMDLAIIRTAPGPARSMNLLEHSVRSIEEFMGAPFPTNYVAVLFSEEATVEGAAGVNFGTHVTMLPEYDVDDGSHDANFLPSLTAHEISHYYWRGSETWIDEGGATFMEFAVEKARVGRGLIADRYPCAYAPSIAVLAALDPDRGAPLNSCNYSLGERIFLDLYRNLGEAAFRQGFSRLYQMRQVLDEYLWPTELDISHVRQAFQPISSAASAIIARWYDGPTPRGIAPPDTGPVVPELETIAGGQIVNAFVSLEDDWDAFGSWDSFISRETEKFSVSDAADKYGFVYLAFTLPVTAQPKILRLEVIEHYEDGFLYGDRIANFEFSPEWTGARARIAVGQIRNERPWLPGRYRVFLYDGDRKVAEVAYEVTP